MNERRERPDPLDRLDAIGQVAVPDLWADIVTRSREPDRAELHAVEPAGHRRNWVLAMAAAAVLVIGAGAVIAVNTGGDNGEISTLTNPPTTPAVTTVPVTTAPVASSTVAPVTEPTEAPTTTEPVQTTEAPSQVPALVSSCPGAEITGNDTISGGGGFERLGRLGLDPSVVVTMPQAQEGDLLQTGSIARGIQRIPGGQVLLVQVDETDPAWQLVAVDDDGSIRWRRCGSGSASDLYASGEGEVVHVRETESVFGGWTAWRSFDVASGADVDPLDVDPAAFALAALGDLVLFESTGLSVLDVAAGTVSDFGYPDIDGEFTFYTFDRGPAGVPVVVAREEQGGPALAVAVDGEWRTDRDTLLASVGLTVVENTADVGNAELGNGVWARDPLGATVWFHPIVNGIRAEGWSTGVVGDIVLVNECRADDTNAAFRCGDPWHIALDLASGDLLWERPGFIAVGPAGEDVAMIAADGDWSLTGLRTGDVVQELDDPFLNECCGLDTFVWTGSDGGVVWSVDHETIRIYYPEALSRPTVAIELGA